MAWQAGVGRRPRSKPVVSQEGNGEANLRPEHGTRLLATTPNYPTHCGGCGRGTNSVCTTATLADGEGACLFIVNTIGEPRRGVELVP